MTSNRSVTELILITSAEYCFMKNHAQNQNKSTDSRTPHILAQKPASLEYPSSQEKQSIAETSRAIDNEQALFAQVNSNSRLQDNKKTNREISIPRENNDRPLNNTADKASGSPLQSGIPGGNIERSRQPEKRACQH